MYNSYDNNYDQNKKYSPRYPGQTYEECEAEVDDILGTTSSKVLEYRLAEAEKQNKKYVETLKEKYPDIIKTLSDEWADKRANIEMTETEYILQNYESRLKKKSASFRERVKGHTISAHNKEMLKRDNILRIYPTGFRFFDMLQEGGIAEGLSVISGRSSLGKTSFFLQLGMQMAMQKQLVVYLSLEMSALNIAGRVDSFFNQKLYGLGLPASTTKFLKLADSDESPEMQQRMFDAIDKADEDLGNWFYVADADDLGGVSLEKCLEYMQGWAELAKEDGLGMPVFLIDYLQYIRPDDSRANWEARAIANRNTFALNDFARQNRTAVICLSSVSRANASGIANEAAAKDSGEIDFTIENNYQLLFSGQGQKDFDINLAKSQNPRKIELIIHKNRLGTGAGITINFEYFPESNWWREINYDKPSAPTQPENNEGKNDKKNKTSGSRRISDF